jgi:branched-chain amino acid transport system ATP-binding protein
MAEAATALRVDGVSKAFSGLIAVNDLSFELGTGEILGLIGPNGSGKTTMINLISGALRPTSGRIMLDNRDIAGLPAHRIARLGIARTFQLVRVLPAMTVLENVAAGGIFGHRRMWGADLMARAEELLQRVGIPQHGHTPVTALTYIDQKRVELARALMADPKVLLLDEWLAGLNPTELQIGIDLIGELHREQRTIIIVEHLMDAIRSLCDRCVVMNGGNRIAEGAPDEVLADRAVIAAYLGEDDA